MTQNPPAREQNLPAHFYENNYEDEISLVDLWLVLAKRRFMMMMVATLCVLAGLAFALLKADVYKYTTSIEIGAEVTSSGVRLVESPETTLAKIDEGYIPQSIQQYVAKNPDNASAYKISAKIPKNSQMVVLEANGTADKAKIYLALMEAIVGKVEADHDRLMLMSKNRDIAELERARIKLEELMDESTLSVKRDDIEIELNNAKVALENAKDPRVFAVPLGQLETKLAQANEKLIELRDQGKLLLAKQQRHVELEQLLRQQVAELKKQLSLSNSQRDNAVTEVNGESKAMVLMMIDNERQQNQNRLDRFEERLIVELPDQLQALEKQIENNKRSQELQKDNISEIQKQIEKLKIDRDRNLEKLSPIVPQLEGKLVKLEKDHRRDIARQKQKVSELEANLANVRSTRAIVQPMKSLEATGPGKSLVMILALVLGLMLGVFAAFFAEFLSKVRHQTATS